MKPDLDQLLKSHLHRQLDPQLGGALETFRERGASRPLVAKRHSSMHIGRWIAAGVAIAACLLIAFLLSGDRASKRDVASDLPQANDVSPGLKASSAPITHTRLVVNTDRGMVMLDDKNVGRRIRRDEINHYRWTDESGAVYEYFAPSEQEVVLAVHQQ